MDIIPILTQLSMLFQKQDLDLALVQPAVSQAISDINTLKTDDGAHVQALSKSLFSDDTGKTSLDGHVLLYFTEAKKNHFKTKIRELFCTEVIKNLETRFPEESSNMISVFAVLGMRPLSFVDNKAEWGNDRIETLIKKYGDEVTVKDGSKKSPLIDAGATRREWVIVKDLVLQEAYPRMKLTELWKIIHTYHRDSFPNLLTLASIASVLPVQTADCERGFSAQNNTKTASRNRLSGEKLSKLLKISINGPSIERFPFDVAVKLWKEKRERRMFNTDRARN
ncbi:uncharacterized protein C17orf113-like [Ptychodera flava]|uniref:uncharacterized protein C17orf113-like n=1 Tax=Ptychodera flava TaxID=63121 RepID=UPI003969F0EF